MAVLHIYTLVNRLFQSLKIVKTARPRRGTRKDQWPSLVPRAPFTLPEYKTAQIQHTSYAAFAQFCSIELKRLFHSLFSSGGISCQLRSFFKFLLVSLQSSCHYMFSSPLHSFYFFIFISISISISVCLSLFFSIMLFTRQRNLIFQLAMML